MESNQQYVPAGLRINKARLPLPLLFQKTLSCVVPRLTKSRLSGDHNGTFEPNSFQMFKFHTVFGTPSVISTLTGVAGVTKRSKLRVKFEFVQLMR